jgi:hypothetical protein
MNKNLLNTIAITLLATTLIGCGGGGGKGQGKGDNGASDALVDAAIASEKSILTPELQDSITYMYSEEKLAKEIYLNLYAIQPVKQLNNIATKSEVKHEDAVDRLAIKYDLNTTLYPDTTTPYDANSLSTFTNGKFPVVAIQELYDTLYEKGVQSQKDALEVGCMVEVTDVEDLDKYIAQATQSNASDVLTIFNFLRDGSYNHYWAFNKGLTNQGITDGCCSLGTDYCHPEYPQN